MKGFILVILLFIIYSCTGQKKEPIKYNVVKTESEWKKSLTAEQFTVLRKNGTERAFTGKYWSHFEKGTYVCAGCNQKLFTSETKFESDCGWPSFDKAIKGAVTYKNDNSFGMLRKEVLCSNCGGHLGHVFDDGPTETTGNRYCTNSASILFIPNKK